MEIGSVVSNAYAKAAVQGERTQQAQEGRTAEAQESKARESRAEKEQPPRPVANAEGQTTGQVINVTA